MLGGRARRGSLGLPAAQAPPLAEPSAPALQGILLVYDITNRWSFDGIDRWIKEIDEVGVRLPADARPGSPLPGPQILTSSTDHRGTCSKGFSLTGLSPTLSQHREGG